MVFLHLLPCLFQKNSRSTPIKQRNYRFTLLVLLLEPCSQSLFRIRKKLPRLPRSFSRLPHQLMDMLDVEWVLLVVTRRMPHTSFEFGKSRSEERRVGKECRSRW